MSALMATPPMTRAAFSSSCALALAAVGGRAFTVGTTGMTDRSGLTKLVSKPVQLGGTAGTATLLSVVFIPRV